MRALSILVIKIFFNNQDNMQNSSLNPNDGSENSEIYNHFDQDSNLNENSYENMLHSSLKKFLIITITYKIPHLD